MNKARRMALALGGAVLAVGISAGVRNLTADRDGGLIAADRLFDPADLVAQERADLRRAEKQSAAAIARSAKLEAQAAAAQDEAEKLKFKSIALAARIQAAEAEIQGAQTRLEALNRKLADQQGNLARQQKPLMDLTALLQQLSRRPPITVLAQPGSLDELVHARAVIEAVMPEVEKKSDVVRRELASLREILAQQSAVMAALEAAHGKLAEQRGALNRLEQDGRARSRQLASGARLEADRAIGLAERARDITALMAALEVDSQKRALLVHLAGPLPRPAWPDAPVTATPPPAPSSAAPPSRHAYRMPVVGRIITGFGELDESGVRSRGLQMFAGSGAQVVAPAAGRVSYAGDYRGYGKILIVDHGSGWISLVAGMIALSAAVGDEVESGAPIGRAGAAGKAITVELRRGGKPVDIMAMIG